MNDLEFINNEIKDIENSLNLAKKNGFKYPNIEARLNHLKSIKAKLEKDIIKKNDNLPYTHLFYVRKFNVFLNDYKLVVYGANTNDIHHTIGEMYYRSFEHIKRIDCVECCQEKLDYWKEQNIEIHNWYDKYK